jgi:hypothetical protein
VNTRFERLPLAAEEESKPYAHLYYRELTPVPGDVLRDIESGPIDPRDALAVADVNALLTPGYMARETGYCFLADGSGYTAVLTRMPGVTGEMLQWWLCRHPLEDLRYKIRYPGAHTAIGDIGIGVRGESPFPVADTVCHLFVTRSNTPSPRDLKPVLSLTPKHGSLILNSQLPWAARQKIC